MEFPAGSTAKILRRARVSCDPAWGLHGRISPAQPGAGRSVLKRADAGGSRLMAFETWDVHGQRLRPGRCPVKMPSDLKPFAISNIPKVRPGPCDRAHGVNEVPFNWQNIPLALKISQVGANRRRRLCDRLITNVSPYCLDSCKRITSESLWPRTMPRLLPSGDQW